MGSKLTRFLSQFKECSLVLEREYISATRKLKGSWPFFLKREKVWKERMPFLERERERERILPRRTLSRVFFLSNLV